MWLGDVEDPTFYSQSVHRWRLGCQPYAPATIYTSERSSDTHFYSIRVNPRAKVRLEELGKLNTFNDLIGIRTRVLPACSIR
jgi:hypothetical protein